jgi:ribonucleoside-diphosphate reductase alpha chain
VWESRYRYAGPTDAVPERSIDETWDRVADALSSVELRGGKNWRRAFRRALADFKFLPGGRILAGAGALKTMTLANCFVSGPLEASSDVIFKRLGEAALTMQWGGGVGCDFSSLPPRGRAAAGPVAHLRLWDAMSATVSAAGARRGAMMGTLRCDHPDIEEFIDAKRTGDVLRHFNLSVAVTDDFMAAVEHGRRWPLRFSNGDTGPGSAVVRLVPARELWERVAMAAYDAGEPGVLFIDRINRANNLGYCERLTTTNPCGEVPLPPHGACVLGSLNLTAFVRGAFTPRAKLDFDGIGTTAELAVRMLDDAVDASLYPLPEQAEQARATRRIGLGITGLGDALIMLGLRYDSAAGRDLARRAVQRARDAAYLASTELAAEKGSFPRFDRDAFLDGEYSRSLPKATRDRIARHGIRNSHLLAIAPAGSISVLANNVSSGLEPVFAIDGDRQVLDEDGTETTHRVEDFAAAQWRRERKGPFPSSFVTAGEIAPEEHLAMVAALQPLVDGSISKTINVPASISRSEFAHMFDRAYELGMKGCTVFRPSGAARVVLTAAACCTPRKVFA